LVLPLSKAVIAVITLWVAVGFWNSYFSAMIFLPTRVDLHPLQLILRRMIVEVSGGAAGGADLRYRQIFGQDAIIFEDGIKMAAVIVATAPILVVYPWLQKYFVKGIYLGSLKG